jgi:RHS repeat-associated protein
MNAFHPLRLWLFLLLLWSLSATAQAYDARGNTASETRPASVSVSTSYDGHGRLISYTRTGEANQANVYNGMDERVTVSSTPSGGATTIRRFVYDPDGRVIGEYGTSATNVIAERIWMTPEIADGGAFGGDDGTGGYAPIALVAGTTLRYVHGNHLGVPALYTSTTGAAVATPAYTLPGFPGQFRTNAELYYNKYRDYDISTGRYIQADPIGLAGGPSPYVYAMGNPVRYTDPTGEVVPLVVLGAIGWGLFDAGMDYAMQRMIDGRSADCIDWSSVAVSGGIGALTGGIGGLGRLAQKGVLEFSHWIPERYINPKSISYKPWLDKEPFRKFINSEWNGNHVPRWLHGQTDFWRRPLGSRVADKWAFPFQQVVRAPTWLWAPAAAVGVGAAGANGDD